MSALLANLSTANDTDIAGEKDSVGNGGVLESAIYLMTVNNAYLDKAKSGALGLHLFLETEQGQEIRQTLYVTSGDKKGNKNYYENQRGEKNYLPGFLHANGLCLLTEGVEIAAMDTEEKTIKVYSPEAKAEVPQKKDVLVDLIGKQVYVGMQKQIVDKRAQADDGSYYATGETREENEIDKLFCARPEAEKMTLTEIQAKAEEAAFFATWEAKFAGKTRDRSTKDAGTAGAPRQAANSASGGNSKPKTSLFG